MYRRDNFEKADETTNVQSFVSICYCRCRSLDINQQNESRIVYNAVKPVCNDQLFNKIIYLWFIQ